jgi:hypothetical protein
MARLLAIGSHEAVSVEKLAELFRSEMNQLFAGTTAAHCPICRGQFAVFFPQSDDPENAKYLGQIEKLIAGECREGNHSAEISLTWG